MERCIYCGHNGLNSDIRDDWKCSRCGLTIARSDYQDIISNLINAQNHPQDQNSAEAVYADEAETLASAWQLMQSHAWDKALDVLLPAAVPSQHPLEFAVWRNICRIALALSDKDLQSRSPLLELLQRNLHCLEYFLSAGTEAQKYQTIKNIYQALKLLRSLVLGYLNDSSPTNDSDSINNINSTIDTTNSLCASILTAVAETLESQEPDNNLETEYLKMSAQLYHWSLELYLAPHNSKCLPEEQHIKLSSKMRSHIGSIIEQLNEKIAQRDKAFIPQKKVPVPKFAPSWAVWLMVIGWLPILFILPLSLLFKDALYAYCQEWGFALPYINDQDFTDACAYTCLSIYAIYFIFGMVKFNNTSYLAHYGCLAQELKTPSQDSESANYSLS